MLHFSKQQANIWQEHSWNSPCLLFLLYYAFPSVTLPLSFSALTIYFTHSVLPSVSPPLYLFKFYFHFSVIIHSLVSAWGPFFFALQTPQSSGHWPTCFDEYYYHSRTPTACMTSLCGNYPLLTSKPRGRVYLQPNDQQNTH